MDRLTRARWGSVLLPLSMLLVCGYIRQPVTSHGLAAADRSQTPRLLPTPDDAAALRAVIDPQVKATGFPAPVVIEVAPQANANANKRPAPAPVQTPRPAIVRSPVIVPAPTRPTAEPTLQPPPPVLRIPTSETEIRLGPVRPAPSAQQSPVVAKSIPQDQQGKQPGVQFVPGTNGGKPSAANPAPLAAKPSPAEKLAPLTVKPAPLAAKLAPLADAQRLPAPRPLASQPIVETLPPPRPSVLAAKPVEPKALAPAPQPSEPKTLVAAPKAPEPKTALVQAPPAKPTVPQPADSKREELRVAERIPSEPKSEEAKPLKINPDPSNAIVVRPQPPLPTAPPVVEKSVRNREPIAAALPPMSIIEAAEVPDTEQPLSAEPLDTTGSQDRFEPIIDKGLVAQPQNAPQAAPYHLPAPEVRPRHLTAEMQAVLSRADGHMRRGFSLAERGAIYSARIEYLQALRLVAEALDTVNETSAYDEALNAGLTALRESRDLIGDATSERRIDVAFVTSAHRTPVLKDGSADKISSLVALQRYYTYAQEQLAAATGHEPAGSKALHALGKLSMVLTSPARASVMESTAHAMVYFQASLIADPNNYLASHELGVLLARSGRLERARNLFMQSLSVSQSSKAWINLAVVHDRLGELDAASKARQQAANVAASEGGTKPGVQVQWLEPEAFAQTKNASEDVLPPTNANPASKAAGQAQARAPEPPKKRTASLFPWKKSSQR